MTRPETVEALAKVVWDGFRASPFVEISPRDAQSVAFTVLAAIDAGQVPGLVTSEAVRSLADDLPSWPDADGAGYPVRAYEVRDAVRARLLALLDRREGGGCDE